MYDWCFKRTVGSREADIVLLETANGEYVAGGALTFRNLKIQTHIEVVATFTAGWTMPEYRGQGCFGKILSALRELANERNAALLLSSVRSNNHSYKGFLTQKFAGIASWYLQYDSWEQADEPGSAYPQELNSYEQSLRKLFESEEARPKSSAHVHYDLTAWTSQFFQRPGCSPTIYELEGGKEHAIINRYALTKSLVVSYLSAREGDQSSAKAILELMNLARRDKMKLLIYTTNPRFAKQCLDHGFKFSSGYIMAKGTENLPGPDSEFLRQLIRSGLDYQDGDKM